MIDGWLEGLEAGGLSSGLRKSLWLYPIVNALHVLGIALLVGPILAFDARVLGLWARVPAATLGSVLLPVARLGFGLAVVTGALLFVARPLDYAYSALFLAKLALIAVALANVVRLHRSAGWRGLEAGARPGAAVRLAAGLSALCWIATVFAGRMLGYR
ncbi:MAG: hypothetical protein AB7P21_19015 [Lautropia sp.]